MLIVISTEAAHSLIVSSAVEKSASPPHRSGAHTARNSTRSLEPNDSSHGLYTTRKFSFAILRPKVACQVQKAVNSL
jgi:hypothetical protein